ncbi:excalibur calcium-binding domain-containing protein [Microbacterium terricola]|uniref:Excalibur calcium-binding domain-containing protein n=1 Tax=Microbacterium terricola TaxID=344163 RepID=A0ABM8DZ82_9MICO|nr:excalibur calcium-binding domain-containing protein [Microbacterium terricola]UYK41354.1 excalibur calcium-binding domain-containing protein [Microbacterium terricola]BDV30862.1 hypothetical protein Microterr_15220 [Microbacterium terricola]
MKISRVLTGAALAGVLVLAPLTGAVAATTPSHPVSTQSVHIAQPKVFKNCTELNKVYKGGVAKKGVKSNMVSGKPKPFKVKPKIDTALYNANKNKDRDKDGIACEKG